MKHFLEREEMFLKVGVSCWLSQPLPVMLSTAGLMRYLRDNVLLPTVSSSSGSKLYCQPSS